MTWLRTTPVAHRGLHDIARGVPENSLAAARAAIAKGYAIELDVQLSRDGVVMVFHDHALKRLTGEAGSIDDRTAAELGRLALLGTAERVPSFREFLGEVAGRVPLLIEFKDFSRRVGGLEAGAMRDLAGYVGEYAVQSFNPSSVLWFRDHAPRVPRGQLRVDLLRARGFSVPERLHFHRGIRKNLGAPNFEGWHVGHIGVGAARRARAAGRDLLCWTVKTEAAKRKARALGANIIFEAVAP
jgi:glycerophosphoryl diester phosphodiesterase